MLIGSGNPHVAEAVARQLREGSGTPLLEPRLAATLPPDLSAYYFLNSLSEANELALRLARARVPGKDVIVLEGADHGMTTSLKNMSPARGPLKFWAHAARRGDPAHVAELARAIEHSGRGLCAFFAEGVFPRGFLNESSEAVRAAGGIYVAVEEQCGLGRVGEPFWEFARHGVTPDIVVIGESLANGLPFAAVVTRPELAAFPPLEGHPAMRAAALAVLEVLERECLPARAERVGAPLRAIATRGAGLCVEFDAGERIVIRPPLTITEAEIAELVERLTPKR